MGPIEEAAVEHLGRGRTPVAAASDQHIVQATIAYVFGASQELPARPANDHQRGVLEGTLETLRMQGAVSTSGREKRLNEVAKLLD